MNRTPELFALRRDELDTLISRHLGAGSLDEGNGAAFDRLIDAWLEQELAAIDLAVSSLARKEEVKTLRRTTVRARKGQRRADRLSRADDRRQALEERRDAVRQRRVRIAEATTARRDQRVVETEQRLKQAQARLEHAERRLVGELVGVPPVPPRDEVAPSGADAAERVA
jgi:small-conductance mechanosensitive channel